LSVTESDLVANILLAFGAHPRVRLWRANVLVAQDKTGRIVRAGVKGQADISGILAPTGQRIEIELKAPKGRQRPEQVAWQAMIEKHGGLYILARSVEDVAKALPPL
jgi:hypothetical protein